MKNKLFPFLFLFPLVTGVCGALLRATQLRYAYEPASGILQSGHPATYGLVTVCIIAFVMALISAFISKDGTDASMPIAEPCASFSAIASAIIILAYAGFIFYSLTESFDVAELILALLSVYCSVSLIVMGKYRFAERDSSAYCIFSAVPVFWACFLLIISFREKTADPIIANYVPLIFGYIAILFFSYGMAAHILGRTKKSVTVFSCFIGIFFILAELLTPVFANRYDIITLSWVREALPLLAFLILMPCTSLQIIKK